VIETRVLIEKMFIEQIDILWKNVNQPKGLVADIPDISHAYQEFADVEKYFPGKKHDQVEVYNYDTRYIPNPLPYMNNESALYYAQSYLRYFVLNYNDHECEESENIEMSLRYFIDQFKNLNQTTYEQIDLAKRIIRYIKPVFDEEINIYSECQCKELND
jgi:hypothetical protein